LFIPWILVEGKPKMGYITLMKLRDYLITYGISTASFAREGGFPFETVRKWRQRSRIPRPKSMLRIKKMTKGRVKENDWYG